MRSKRIRIALLFIFSIGIVSIGAGAQGKSSQLLPADKNELPITIKERITEMKEALEKDAEQFPVLIGNLETFGHQCTDSAAIAVLHSMIAEMYQNYYQQNRWNIDRRTSISNYTPEDIREWSGNLFKEKIEEELRASLEPGKILQGTSINDYKVLLEKTDKSEYIYPTLFDFLLQRAITIQPEELFYDKWLTFRSHEPNQRATLLTKLSYLEYHYNQLPYSKNTFEKYSEALDSLLQQHALQDFSNEIRIAQINILNRYRFADSKEDSILTRQVEICKKGIKLFPDYPRTNSLRNTLNDLQLPSLSINNQSNVYPGGELKLKINYRNLSNLTIRIYKSNRSIHEISEYAPENQKRQRGRLVKQVTVALNLRQPYLMEDTLISTSMQTPGQYEFVVTSADQKIESQSSFSVSKLASISRMEPGDRQSIFVADFQSGKPISKAAVVSYKLNDKRWIAQDTLYTNNDGIVLVEKEKKWTHYRAILPDDTAAAISSLRNYAISYSKEESEQKTVAFLTDRTIYRPGQTVFFKGIAYLKAADAPVLLTGKKFTVRLRDSNRKEIISKEFTSSDYGSFHGELTLPSGILNGSFSIETDGGYTSFRVEEYKRPGFKLEIEPVAGEVSFGIPLNIKGAAKTFSGVTLKSGKVEYRILRRPFLMRSYFEGTAERQIVNGQVSVDSEGKFAIPFTPQKEEDESRFAFPLFYQYELIARFTDDKGETQEQHSSFAVGETGFLLSIQLQQTMNKENAAMTITAETANQKGNLIVSGELQIYALEGRPGESQKEGERVIKGAFTTGQTIQQEVFSQLASGAYRIKAEAKDSLNRTVKAEQDFILFGNDDKKPPVYSRLWIAPGKTDYLPGEEVSLTFGTSEKVYVLYELFTSGNCLKREVIRAEEENHTVRFLFPSTHPEGIIASLSLIKEGEIDSKQVIFSQKQPDHTLKIKTETFRDHLLPGEKETWKLKVENSDSTGVVSEMLAGLYDASLDQLDPFAWSFYPWSTPGFYLPAFAADENFRTRYADNRSSANYQTLPVSEIGFYRLDWQGALNAGYGFDLSAPGMMRSAGISVKSLAKAAISMDAAGNDLLREEKSVEAEKRPSDEYGARESAEKGNANPQIRQNLQETAFFYPTLRTDSAGQVVFSFTLPESNTTWKLQTLAHTRNLEYGYLAKEIISKKPLMVAPNLPRFVREGDLVSLQSSLMNQSGEMIRGKIWIEFFDPNTDQVITGLTSDKQPFNLLKDSINTFHWSFKVPEGINLLGCRIVADSKKYSDGEQHLLPVLSQQVHVTESLPFYLTGEGLKTITEPSVQHPSRLTLELSSNPIWYAVQALPTLEAPTNANLVSLFASYYSQTLAASIAKANPKIRQLVTRWQAEGKDTQTLLSNLYKNEGLKSILLEETPWVMEAKNETEQKQRLSLLFDLNRSANIQSATRQKLIEQQLPDGSWSWFEGFSGDRTITLYILSGMNQLTELNAVEYNEDEKAMQIRAIQYLDRMIVKDYAPIKKAGNKANGGISSTQLNYLLVRSAFRDIPEDSDTREAIRYYTARATANWKNASLYGKGQTALLAHRNGDKQTAQTILNWLRKTATTTPERGMYWANNRMSGDFFFSPIDTHCLLLSVFYHLSPNQQEADRLKQWLLTEKRTQDWSSIPSTSNAIYALLLTGTDWLKKENVCVVSWRGKTVDTSKEEAGTGYFKHQMDITSTTPAADKIKIQKKGTAPAWGALYVQYQQPISKIQKQGGEISIDRKLFIERIDKDGRKITPLATGASLHVGERVVIRLTIRSDKTLHYVFLKDLRPGCMEPNKQLSGAEYREGVCYYHSPQDASEQFFFDRLPAGTFVIEYTLDVSRSGYYTGGLSTIQCLYAPEYVAHSQGEALTVE